MTDSKLILFDIDGTLLHTHGVSKSIFCRALSETFRAEIRWENYSYSGQPDRRVALDLLKIQAGIHAPPEKKLAFAFQRMGELWSEYPRGQGFEVYPGVQALLTHLSSINHLFLGQLTANVKPSAVGKLIAAGYDPNYFPAGGYGEDAVDRNDLFPIAVDRCRDTFQQIFAASDTVVVGDSPADIVCARHNGAQVIAVATGYSDYEKLKSYQPDLLIRDVASGMEAVLDFLGLA